MARSGPLQIRDTHPSIIELTSYAFTAQGFFCFRWHSLQDEMGPVTQSLLAIYTAHTHTHTQRQPVTNPRGILTFEFWRDRLRVRTTSLISSGHGVSAKQIVMSLNIGRLDAKTGYSRFEPAVMIIFVLAKAYFRWIPSPGPTRLGKQRTARTKRDRHHYAFTPPSPEIIDLCDHRRIRWQGWPPLTKALSSAAWPGKVDGDRVAFDLRPSFSSFLGKLQSAISARKKLVRFAIDSWVKLLGRVLALPAILITKGIASTPDLNVNCF